MALKIYSHPAFEPVSVDEARDHLRLTATDEDAIIANIIKAATRWAEDYTGYRFCTQTWTFTLDSFPYKPTRVFNGKPYDDYEIIKVPYPPLQSVTHIKYYDTSDVLQTLSASDYRVDTESEPGRIQPVESWPDTYDKINPVEIRFVCGWDDVDDIDDQIKTAILLRVSDLYENRQDSYVTMGPLSIQKNSFTAMNQLDMLKIFDRTW